MEIKILQVFYGKDGLPYKDKDRQVHFPITGTGFLGASNTTKIKFYYDELDNLDETTWVAVSKLPNGKVGSRVLESYLDEELNEHYALLELDNYYTQYKGDVFISLQGYQGGVDFDYDEENSQYEIHGTPTIAATGSIKFTINYANQFVGSGQTDNINFQRILAALGTKLGMRAYSEHVEELPSEGSPDVFYVVNDDPNDPNLQNIYVWNENTRHYIWVGDNTLDLGEYYTKEQGEDFEESIDTRVTHVENELSNVASGSPKGVYATLEDLQAAYPTGTTGIYVVSADGHWYYWNGSAWISGGIYQASETPLNSIDISKITEDIANNFESINLFDKTKLNSGGYFADNGNIYVEANSKYSTQYIRVKSGTTYRCSSGLTSNLAVATYDAVGNFVSRVIFGHDTQTVTFGDSVAFVRLSMVGIGFPATFMFCENDKFPATYQDYSLKLNVNAIPDKSINNDKLGVLTIRNDICNKSLQTILDLNHLPLYSIVEDNVYPDGGGNKTSFSGFTSISIYAYQDFDIGLSASGNPAAYLSLAVFKNGTWNSSNFVARYRNVDNNLPTTASKMTIHQGELLVISYTSSSSFSFDVVNLINAFVFKDDLELNDKMKSSLGLDRVSVNVSGNDYLITMGKYKFQFYKATNVSTNLDSYDIDKVYIENTLLEEGNILGVMLETGQSDFMGGVAHGDETIISMNIYCDGTPITNSVSGKRVDIYLISNLTRVSDHTTNVIKRLVHIVFENNKMTVETTFKCLVDNFSCQVAYVGMWGQYTSQINAIFNNVYVYDVSNYESKTFGNDELKFTSYISPNGIVSINLLEGYKQPSAAAQYVYYSDTLRLKSYYSLANNITMNTDDILYGKSVYEFS